MKNLSNKQQRKERKKKKLAALVNIIKMNDEESLNTMSHAREISDDSGSDIQPIENSGKSKDDNIDDDGFTLVERKKRRSKPKPDEKPVKIEPVEVKSKGMKRKRRVSEEDVQNQKKVQTKQTTKAQPIHSGHVGEIMNTQEYSQYMAEVRTRRPHQDCVPLIEIIDKGFQACLDTQEDSRVPIFLTDVQHMLMTPLFDRDSPCPPSRWLHIKNPQKLTNSVIVVLEGLTLYHFLEHQDKFCYMNRFFDFRMEVTFPPYKEHAILEELVQAPLIYAHAFELIKQHGCLEIAVDMNKDPMVAVKGLFNIASEKQISNNTDVKELFQDHNFNDDNNTVQEKNIERTNLLESVSDGKQIVIAQFKYQGHDHQGIDHQNISNFMNGMQNLRYNDMIGYEKTNNVMIEFGNDGSNIEDKLPRTKLLLSALQMVDEGYPVPLRGDRRTRFDDYICTKELYDPVSDKSPLFAVDCEMCKTSIGYNELTRISIVNEQLKTVYETLVLPSNKIIDYLTRYSGITPFIMKAATKKLKDVQHEVKKLLPPDAILVGQSLNSDLNAMRMFHPYVIDTSICYNMTGERKRKSKLQALALRFLQQEIQKHEEGHDSVEDSLASIRLVKMKLANSLEFGDEVLLKRKRCQEIISMANAETEHRHLKPRKRTALVHSGPISEKIANLIAKTAEVDLNNFPAPVALYEEPSNKDTVKRARQIIKDNGLTIVHLNFKPEQFESTVIDYTIEKINKLVTKLWRTTPCHGLFSVLMAGSKDCTYGTLQVNIKQSTTETV